jgi:hypothetical protein
MARIWARQTLKMPMNLVRLLWILSWILACNDQRLRRIIDDHISGSSQWQYSRMRNENGWDCRLTIRTTLRLPTNPVWLLRILFWIPAWCNKRVRPNHTGPGKWWFTLTTRSPVISWQQVRPTRLEIQKSGFAPKRFFNVSPAFVTSVEFTPYEIEYQSNESYFSSGSSEGPGNFSFPHYFSKPFNSEMLFQ